MSLPNLAPSGKSHWKKLIQPSTPFKGGEPRASQPSGDLIQLCADYFTHHLYAMEPIVDRSMIEYALRRMDTDTGAGSRHLLWSLCAYVLLHPRTEFSGTQQAQLHGKDRFIRGRVILELVCQQRVLTQPLLDATEREDPRVWSIITPVLIAGAHSSLQDDRGAWHNLREATSNAYACGLFGHPTFIQQGWVLHLLLFVTERLYALKLLRWEQRLPLTVIPPLISGDWGLQQGCDGAVNTLILAYLLLSQVGHYILNGICVEGFSAEWQGLELDVIKGLSWRSDETQVLEMRCLQHWLRAVICPRMLPLQGWRPTPEWRDVVIATLQDTLHLIRVAKASGLSGVLDVRRLCDVAVFGLDVFSAMEASWPDAGNEVLRYVDHIVTETAEMMKGTPTSIPSLSEKLYDIRSRITSIQVTKQALVSCAPAHLALNHALQNPNNTPSDRVSGADSPSCELQKASNMQPQPCGVLRVRTSELLC